MEPQTIHGLDLQYKNSGVWPATETADAWNAQGGKASVPQ